MNIIKFPKEIVEKIFNYTKDIRCYGCNKQIDLYNCKWVVYENNKYCSYNCTEYKHY